jgi:hypothetical protein
MVSEGIPPIAVYDVELPEMRMTATDWGLGAKTLLCSAACFCEDSRQLTLQIMIPKMQA